MNTRFAVDGGAFHAVRVAYQDICQSESLEPDLSGLKEYAITVSRRPGRVTVAFDPQQGSRAKYAHTYVLEDNTYRILKRFIA